MFCRKAILSYAGPLPCLVAVMHWILLNELNNDNDDDDDD